MDFISHGFYLLKAKLAVLRRACEFEGVQDQQANDRLKVLDETLPCSPNQIAAVSHSVPSPVPLCLAMA
jgi:hypothetical protein